MADEPEEFINTEVEPTTSKVPGYNHDYSSIVTEFKTQDEWICDICNSSAEQDGEYNLVQCEMCLVVVHDTCFGRELLDDEVFESDDPWYCPRCKYLLEVGLPPKTVECYLCPDRKGMIVDVVLEHNERWAHISCVNSIVEIWFKENSTKEIVGQLLNPLQFQEKCSLCKLIGGYPIFCDMVKCNTKFHSRCARAKGLIKTLEEHEEQFAVEDWNYKVYCSRHQEKGKEKVKKRKLCAHL